ncbi:MAG: flavin reductase [Betaproteobacteria bacterium]|nr:flavin reductase [Betaproteobacteria bacterium]
MSDSDHSAFRQALAKFPTGVTVVTAHSPSRKVSVGLTVSSFNSVSLSPPLVLWSISSQSQHLDAFEAGLAHRIHVLAQGQEDLALRFARSGPDKFADLQTRDMQTQGNESKPQHEVSPFDSIPILARCCARFDCITEVIHDAGDHCVIIARVLCFEVGQREPLVFAHGRFFGLSKRSSFSDKAPQQT